MNMVGKIIEILIRVSVLEAGHTHRIIPGSTLPEGDCF